MSRRPTSGAASEPEHLQSGHPQCAPVAGFQQPHSHQHHGGQNIVQHLMEKKEIRSLFQVNRTQMAESIPMILKKEYGCHQEL